jgi:hypothetical protein
MNDEVKKAEKGVKTVSDSLKKIEDQESMKNFFKSKPKADKQAKESMAFPSTKKATPSKKSSKNSLKNEFHQIRANQLQRRKKWG